ADSTKTLLQEFRYGFLQGNLGSNGCKVEVLVFCSAGRFRRTRLAHGRGSPIAASGLASTQAQSPTKDRYGGRDRLGDRGYAMEGNPGGWRWIGRRLHESLGLPDKAFRA